MWVDSKIACLPLMNGDMSLKGVLSLGLQLGLMSCYPKWILTREVASPASKTLSHHHGMNIPCRTLTRMSKEQRCVSLWSLWSQAVSEFVPPYSNRARINPKSVWNLLLWLFYTWWLGHWENIYVPYFVSINAGYDTHWKELDNYEESNWLFQFKND